MVPTPISPPVRQALGQLGVPAQRVHVERFLSLAENPFEATETDRGHGRDPRGACLGRQTAAAMEWPPGTRLLDVLIDQGLDPPFSCRQGICGACACQLTAGQVEMAHNEALEADDVADGYVLACQSVALTPEVSITY